LIGAGIETINQSLQQKWNAQKPRLGSKQTQKREPYPPAIRAQYGRESLPQLSE